MVRTSEHAGHFNQLCHTGHVSTVRRQRRCQLFDDAMQNYGFYRPRNFRLFCRRNGNFLIEIQ